MFLSMLNGAEIILGVDFNKDREKYIAMANATVYTGAIDELFDYSEGALEYRSLRFETSVVDCSNVQGVAVMNFTEREVPYTRRIEHKHFKFGQQPKSVITYEYPVEWKLGDEPYYPINDVKNNSVYHKYLEKTKSLRNFYIGGRLGEYKYYDMQDTIISAMKMVDKIINDRFNNLK